MATPGGTVFKTMATRHRLSVIIPHRGDPYLLAGCLEALAGQSEAPDEIIIANNGEAEAGEEIQALARAYRLDVAVIHAAQRGAGPARNAGVAASTAEWLAFLDGDCKPAANWVAQGRQALMVRPLFGGLVVVVPADVRRPTPAEAFDLEFGFDAHRFLRRAGHLLTPNLFCTRAIFEKVGPFRVGVPEDKDWSHRAVATGERLSVVSEAVVVHPALTDQVQLAFRWRRMTREEYQLGRERRLGVLRFWLRSWLVLGSMGPHSLRVLQSPRLRNANRFMVMGVMARSRIDRFLLAQQLVLQSLR